jgi:DNA polymerase I
MSKKNSNRKKVVLLDSHAILHRAYHALPDFSSSVGEPTGALYGLSLMLISILKDLKPDYVFAAFDLPKPTYRHEVYENYKAGRKKTDDNLVKQIIKAREIFKSFSIPIYEKEGYEADDVLGTLSTQLKKDFDVIIASGDMDTIQLISGDNVRVYTLKKGIKDLIIYNEKNVLERYGFSPKQIPDYKGLAGDSSDNIIGVPGIGEKTATNLIQNFNSLENIYKELEKNNLEKFAKAGVKERMVNLLIDNKEEALFSKMLATIDCNVPIDFYLPEKSWQENLDINEIRKIFRELEFKSLISKIEQLVGYKQDSLILENSTSDNVSNENNVSVEKKAINEIDLEKAKIGLWLIDSSITNPETQDILNFGKTEDFEKAFQKIKDLIKERGLDFVYENIELPIFPIVKEMNENGILIDRKFLENLSTEYHKELSQSEKEIWQMSGEEFNVNSSQQLAQVLFEKMGLRYKGMKKTSTGRLSTKEEVLQKLAEENEIALKLLNYRELQKLLSTYIDNLPQMISEDGRLRTSFVQTGTTTGRMSSNNPNLQNIPIGSERGQKIRKAFIAPEGKILVAFDYSQIELRIAAILSEDKKLVEIFKSGEDVHTAVASEIFNIPEKEVTKEMRRQAKVINFGMLYGMGVNALRQGLGTDRKTAQEFYNKYFLIYADLAEYLNNVKRVAANQGYVETLFGRRRYFEGFKSSLPFVRAQAERMAINAPIQGTQADMIKISMKKIDDYLIEKKIKSSVKLILQIHDEVVYEVDEDLLEKTDFEKDVKEIMASVLSTDQNKNVPIITDCHFGKNWGDLK